MDLLNDLTVENRPALKRKRWIASFIDHFIYLLIYIVVIYSFGIGTTEYDGTRRWVLSGPAMLLPLAMWIVMFPFMEAFNYGQTIGKVFLNLKVIKEDGSNASFGYCLIRHLLDIVDYLPILGIIGLVVASNNSKKQRVGDLVAKTMVVEALK